MGKQNSYLFQQVHEANANGLIKTEMDAVKGIVGPSGRAIKQFAEKNPDFPVDVRFLYEKQGVVNQDAYEEELQKHTIEFLQGLQEWQKTHADDPDVYCLMAYCLLFGGDGGDDNVRYEQVPECLDYVLQCEEQGKNLTFGNPPLFWYLLCYFSDFENWHDNKYGNSLKSNDQIQQPTSSYPNTNFSHGTSSSGGGCYVATAVYGSYDCPEVWTLRRYRDFSLAKSWHGRLFIHVYYAISPKLVAAFGKTTWFKSFWRTKLDRIIKKLQDEGVESTYYEDRQW